MVSRKCCWIPLVAGLVLSQGRTPVRAQDRPPAAVIVADVERRQAVRHLSVVGEVRPLRGSLVASESEGRVKARVKDLGDSVATGDVMVRLTNDRLVASLAEARADADLQNYNYEQATRLLKTDAISEQNLRDSRYQKARAHAKLLDLESSVRELRIRAPYAGHIVDILVEAGEWVSRGQAVVRLIETDTVRIHVNVPEVHVDAISPGDRAEVRMVALRATPLTGRIVAVMAEGLAESHTFPVIVEVPNPDGRIRSNMAATVRFSIQQPDDLLLVHKDALVTGPQGTLVYLVVDGKAVARPVQPGVAYQEYVAVSGDLSPGDVAVVRGNERLQDGQAVSVIRKLE